MTGMCLGPGEVVFRWWEKLIMVSVILVVFGGMAGLFWHQNSLITARQDASAREEEASKYKRGEIVRSRVTRFRGVVRSVDCYQGCSYNVRFPQASMQAVWVKEYEIEAAQ